jgi:hypothetical protein
MRHRDAEERHGQDSRYDQPLCELFGFTLSGELLSKECIGGACDHRCPEAGLLDNAYDFVCGNITRGCHNTGAAGRKVYGRGDDTLGSPKLAFDAACTGGTGHPGDV